MLRLLLLVLYLAALSASDPAKIGGGWDPDGLTTPAPGDIGGGLDPNGLTGNLDPNG
jgi:hypothetical protein